MATFKLTIEYDGTLFCGWQTQPGKRTVQNEIEKALKKILKEKVSLIASGRTDSGTHAAAQVAHFKAGTRHSPQTIQRALNAHLPDDIAILKASLARKSFHARYNAKRKRYRYTILNRQAPCALNRNFCLHYPHKLDVGLMQNEAKVLTGTKDFKSFQANDSSDASRSKDTVRRVTKLMVRKKGDYIMVDIEASGFLYKMVRNITGVLLDIGCGRLKKGSMRRILKAKNRQSASKTAPAKGLCLMKVIY